MPTPSEGPIRARSKAGERMHVSGRTVDAAEQIIKGAAPALLEKVRSGHVTLNEAKKIVHLHPDAPDPRGTLRRRRGSVWNRADQRKVWTIVHRIPARPATKPHQR